MTGCKAVKCTGKTKMENENKNNWMEYGNFGEPEVDLHFNSESAVCLPHCGSALRALKRTLGK
jgi:hypothetical protein